MEIRQLVTFITVVQFGSFSKAAAELGYSQSAVTVQIRRLEEELNTRLLDRFNKQVIPTAQGRDFLVYSHNILQEMNKAKLSLADDKELCNPLHIGTLESICFAKLPSILHYFRSNHPKVSVSITNDSPETLIRMMERNQLDLIYILDEPRYDINWEKVMEHEEPIVFVGSRISHQTATANMS